MLHTYRWFWVACILITLPLRCSPQVVDACCPAFALGHEAKIADQNILIAWDPETQIEHFVREAAFHRSREDRNRPSEVTDEESFGFLVPTPSRPEIEAIPEEGKQVWVRLAGQVLPRIDRVDRTTWSAGAALLLPFMLQSSKRSAKGFPPTNSAVKVLETKQVAGYDVAVLQASDAESLTNWLQSHGYDSRPALQQWSEPYVAKGWIITAFKYASEGTENVRAGSVRMSFKTDRPIFPYRVPTDQIAAPGAGHVLRTYVVGPGRANGTLGEADAASPWRQAKLRYAMPLSDEHLLRNLAGALPNPDAYRAKGMWLTAWNDPTWPSGTEDLRFDFEPDGASFQEVQTVFVDRNRFIPVDLLLLGALGGLAFWRRRRTR